MLADVPCRASRIMRDHLPVKGVMGLEGGDLRLGTVMGAEERSTSGEVGCKTVDGLFVRFRRSKWGTLRGVGRWLRRANLRSNKVADTTGPASVVARCRPRRVSSEP